MSNNNSEEAQLVQQLKNFPYLASNRRRLAIFRAGGMTPDQLKLAIRGREVGVMPIATQTGLTNAGRLALNNVINKLPDPTRRRRRTSRKTRRNRRH